MAAAPVKIRTKFNLHCYTYEGIDAIRESLIEAKKKTSDDTFKLCFQMIAPPEYKAEVVTRDKNGGTERLEKALEVVQAEIKSRGGLFKLVAPPTRIGQKGDDIDNEDIIAQLAKNEEEMSSGEESNEEGIDVDLGIDDVQVAEDD